MAYGATRLTCYALLSAIEEDLRLCLSQACAGRRLEEVLGQDPLAEALRRYRRDTGSSADMASLEDLLPYVDYQIACDALQRNAGALADDAAAVVRAHAEALQGLTGIRNRVA